MRYKKLGEKKSAILDSMGLLNCCSRSKAERLVPSLIQSLSEEQHDMVDKLNTDEITLRKECAMHYALRPRQSQESRVSHKFHGIYVRYLEYIKKQLSKYKSDREARVVVKEQDPAVNEIEQLEEEVHHANEARSEDDEEPDDKKEADNDEKANDDEGAPTLAQADFFIFLEILIAQIEEAAALWTEVKQGKLPIWVAAVCQ